MSRPSPGHRVDCTAAVPEVLGDRLRHPVPVRRRRSARSRARSGEPGAPTCHRRRRDHRRAVRRRRSRTVRPRAVPGEPRARRPQVGLAGRRDHRFLRRGRVPEARPAAGRRRGHVLPAVRTHGGGAARSRRQAADRAAQAHVPQRARLAARQRSGARRRLRADRRALRPSRAERRHVLPRRRRQRVRRRRPAGDRQGADDRPAEAATFGAVRRVRRRRTGPRRRRDLRAQAAAAAARRRRRWRWRWRNCRRRCWRRSRRSRRSPRSELRRATAGLAEVVYRPRAFLPSKCSPCIQGT